MEHDNFFLFMMLNTLVVLNTVLSSSIVYCIFKLKTKIRETISRSYTQRKTDKIVCRFSVANTLIMVLMVFSIPYVSSMLILDMLFTYNIFSLVINYLFLTYSKKSTLSYTHEEFTVGPFGLKLF